MKLAVVDVETTGLNPTQNRITEIGIVFIENGRVISHYESLVNPSRPIPENIQLLTGISNKMVQKQPLFDEIAESINEMTRDCIVVGHNVNFDYSFLKSEMKLVGIRFSRKTLCTAELTRLLHNNFSSYSLASLCKIFKIPNRCHHRALPDAEVTATLFCKLIAEKEPGFLESLFSKKSNLIPEHLQETVYNQLPAKAGVYYFIGKNGKPFYIGKAANIRKRVISHFRGDGNSLKIVSLGSNIKKIRFEETGNELLASLLEDHEIRHFWPSLNRAQKKNTVTFGVVTYLDQKGRWRMNIATSGKMHYFKIFFHQYHLAADFIRKKIIDYNLDGTLCGIGDEANPGADNHNCNFEKMLREMHDSSKVELFYGHGRNSTEISYVWIENNLYKGFGFVEAGKEKDTEVLASNLSLRFSSITSETIIRKIKDSHPSDWAFDLKNPGCSQG